MPDKGWRKRLHDKRPKTPIQTKPTGDTAEKPGNKQIEHRLQSSEKFGWRKTHHESRPQTPASQPSSIAGGDDAEDGRSDTASDAETTRRRSAPKPKLSRYLTDYLSLTATPKGPEFTQPWNEDIAPVIEPPTDPLLVVTSVRSHICKMSWKPVPVEHNSGLLRVFEDYWKVREQKERLDGLLKETLDGFQTAEECWATAKGCYQAEIRRLELIIARGTSGMAGLVKVREGSTVNRRRAFRKAMSTERFETTHEVLTSDQLDAQIKARSQKVHLYRPSSPSGKMTALSKRFSTMISPAESPIGTPPSQNRKTTLSREVKSELNLATMGKLDHSTSNCDLSNGAFSLSKNPLPDEAELPEATRVDPGIDCEALVALRELATLVARRRGLNVEHLDSRLMELFYIGDKVEAVESGIGPHGDEASTIQPTQASQEEGEFKKLTEHSIRRFNSQPQLTADQHRRRHFSFEPGDDLGILNRDWRRIEFDRPKSPVGSQSTVSLGDPNPLSGQLPENLLARSQILSADNPKPSMIPSPANRTTLGRVRRESSTSSLQSVSGRVRLNDRRDSRSSVMTAFRENSRGSLQRPRSTSINNSLYNLRQAESQHQPGDQAASLRLRNSVIALAAAHTAGTASSSASESKTTSPVKDRKRTSAMTSPSSRRHTASKTGRSSENDAPWKRS